MSTVDNFSLHNFENYNKELKQECRYILNQFIELNNKFLLLSLENIQIQDKIFKQYVMKKGVETIEHIFIFLIFYTLNNDLTYYHCEQGYVYYVEFIGQMIMNGDTTGFALTSKDAILFVFKKTIFEISKEYRENNPLNENYEKKIKLIKQLTSTYKNLLFLYIDNLNTSNTKLNENETKTIRNIIVNFFVNVFENNTINSNYNNSDNAIEILNYFIDFIRKYDKLSIHNKLNVLELFIKKYNKQSISNEIIKNKMRNEIMDYVLNDNNYNYSNIIKLFTWLFNC